MSNPLPHIIARDLAIFTSRGYTRHYNPITIDTRGSLVLDKTVNIFFEEMYDDPESPVTPAGILPYMFVDLVIPVIRITKRDNDTLDAIAVEMQELLVLLSEHTEGSFPPGHLQIMSPVTIKGEPLGANAMKYIYTITHHFKKED